MLIVLPSLARTTIKIQPKSCLKKTEEAPAFVSRELRLVDHKKKGKKKAVKWHPYLKRERSFEKCDGDLGVLWWSPEEEEEFRRRKAEEDRKEELLEKFKE